MSITVRDLAAATGLSIGTISRALKHQDGLSDATRALVLKTAQDLGYDFGRLKQARIRRVAFLLHRQHNTLAGSPFYSPVLHGVESACRGAGIVPSFLALGPADPLMEQLRLHAPDALVCAGYFEPEMLTALRATGKPVALVDMRAPGFASVNPDHAGGAYRMVRHLIAGGRRRVAFIAGSLAHYSIAERMRGFRRALFEAKILADPELEIVLPAGVDPEQSIQEATSSLLGLPQPPDAIFCYNDSTALGVMRCCLDAGAQVPGDISIAGFDDIPSAAHARPPLSTVHVDKEALGRAGVELLLRSPDGPITEQVLPVELMLRASTQDRTD